MKKRLDAKVRSAQLLDVAVKLAAKKGYNKITREEIAAEANVSSGLITNYFGTMPSLRRTIMRAAIHREDLTIIAQGLTARDPHALKAPAELKQRAAQSLI